MFNPKEKIKLADDNSKHLLTVLFQNVNGETVSVLINSSEAYRDYDKMVSIEMRDIAMTTKELIQAQHPTLFNTGCMYAITKGNNNE